MCSSDPDGAEVPRILPRRLVALLLCTVLGASPMVLADDPVPVSLEQAIAQVTAQYPGRVLAARTEVDRDRVTYVIRILTDDQQVRQFELPGAQP